MSEWLAQTGLGLTIAALMIGCLLAAGWVTDKISKRFFPTLLNQNVGCLAQLVTFLIAMAAILAVFGPAIEALKARACRASEDRRECMDTFFQSDGM